jgi:hypothetical protein
MVTNKLISLCTKLSASQNYSDGKEGRAGLRLNLVGQTGPRRRHPRQCKGLQKSSPSGGAFIRLSKINYRRMEWPLDSRVNYGERLDEVRQRSLHLSYLAKGQLV